MKKRKLIGGLLLFIFVFLVCLFYITQNKKDSYIPCRNHDKKWGEPEFTFTDSTDYPNCSELHIRHENVNTKEDKHLERKEFRRLMNKPEELKKQDIDMLFDYMKKHIQTWWD